jgi:uncharacterized protein YbaP (TraB family)
VVALGAAAGCAHGAADAPAATAPVAAKPTPPTGATAAEPNGPFLWRVDGPKTPIYLYGTVHTGGRDIVPAAAWERLKTTRTFVMETDVEHADKRALAMRGINQAGPGLDEQLGPDLFGKLKEMMGPGVKEEKLKRFKPWFAGLVVLQSIMGPTEATDAALCDAARQAGQGLEFLERIEEQFAMLEQALDLEVLKQMLAEKATIRTQLDEILDAYKAGDTAAVERLTMDDKQMTPAARAMLIDGRNAAWIPAIEKFAQTGDVFVAVGAAHLVGPKGVVALLRGKGYKITRVTQ